MQLALCVQLPQRLGGASGSACFLSTSWTLQTNRLVEIANNHPLLSPALCGLADIHTIKTPTIPILLHVLSQTFPAFLDDIKSRANAKPVKLLVIDAITELFHSEDKVTSSTLVERAKNLTEISTLLHMLAHRHGLAVIVLNEVIDAVDRGSASSYRPHEVSYKDQARLFNRADSIPAEKAKEAALGLVWANQVNVRIMLTRTHRVRILDDTEYRPAKRRRVEEGCVEPFSAVTSTSEPIRVRRMSVIFSSLALPTSLDYIVTQGGVVVLEGLEESVYANARIPSPAGKAAATTPAAPLEEVCPLDLPFADGDSRGSSSDLPSSLPLSGKLLTSTELDKAMDPHPSSGDPDPENGPQDEDEWEAYWRDTDIGSDIYDQLTLDVLSSDRDRPRD